MDSKDLTIGVLSTTAVIMFVGILIVSTQPPQAYADMVDRGGDYIVTTGNMWEAEEMVYVFDTRERKMMIYRYNRQNDDIIAQGPASLDQFLNAQAQQGNPRGRGGRRGP